jgi:hypothetical protein
MDPPLDADHPCRLRSYLAEENPHHGGVFQVDGYASATAVVMSSGQARLMADC